MAATPKALSRGLLAASSTTLYTVPAATTAIITNILLANTSASAVAVTLALDGVVVVPAVSCAANTTTAIDLRQVLTTTKQISGFAATAAVIACHISGAEVS
jgi:hypothetical protein